MLVCCSKVSGVNIKMFWLIERLFLSEICRNLIMLKVASTSIYSTLNLLATLIVVCKIKVVLPVFAAP